MFPGGEFHYPFTFFESSDDIIFVPASFYDEFLCRVVESGSSDSVVPLPYPFSDKRGVCFEGIFVEVVEDKEVHGVSGE